MKPSNKRLQLSDVLRFFRDILGPENNFYWLAIIYGIGISLLSLATPISVQMLINTVANTGLITPLIVLSFTLFGLLLLSGLFNALRIHLMELFSRRFYARTVAEISLQSVHATDPFFNDASNIALFNRYFDIMGVQKAVPVLFIGGFTVLLQAGVGFILVSLYHPLFLVFNLVVICLIWVIWLMVGRRAVFSAIELSHAKHNTAAWLQSLGESNGYFNSDQRIDFALKKTDKYTNFYITARERHFRHHFVQTVSFLFLFAAASATLLGLGGWLVISGQLGLGQLVAAELILSAAFFGVSQLGIYLEYFYDLCAAVEELNHFYNVEKEELKSDDAITVRDHTLTFKQKVFKSTEAMARGHEAIFNFTIPSGTFVCAMASDYRVQRIFTNLLKRHAYGGSGIITLGGVDIVDLNTQNLRQNILVIGRADFIGSTIREYLSLATQSNQSNQVIKTLDWVGLTTVVASLNEGLDTKIATTGWPLSTVEIVRLKLANALLSGPKILILNQLHDLLDEQTLRSVVTQLKQQFNTTVIYFTQRENDLGFDAFLSFEANQQRFHENHQALLEAPLSTLTEQSISPKISSNSPTSTGGAR